MIETLTEKTTESLNDLIIINNDRYEGYQKAMEQSEDADIKTLFSKYSTDSKRFSSELRTYLPDYKDAPERDETRLSGKFYRAWMDVKNALSSNNRKEVLSSCEYGEDVAKKAYENVLTDRESMPADTVNVIQKQFDQIMDAHNTIKKLRDSVK